MPLALIDRARQNRHRPRLIKLDADGLTKHLGGLFNKIGAPHPTEFSHFSRGVTASFETVIPPPFERVFHVLAEFATILCVGQPRFEWHVFG